MAEQALDAEHSEVDAERQGSDAAAIPAAPGETAPEDAEQQDTADEEEQDDSTERDAADEQEESQQETQQGQKQEQQQEQEDEAAAEPAEDIADAPAAETRTAHTHSRRQASPSRAAASTSPGRAARVKLTFSGPPNAGMAKPYVRSDYSHSQTKLLKIAHDNEVLVKKLTDISRQAPSWVTKAKEPPSAAAALATGANASAAVNRRKAAASIAQENHALYQRLVAIKPSRDISRETLGREHALNTEYMRRASNFKPGQVRATSSSPGRR